MDEDDKPIVRAIIGSNPYVSTNARPLHFNDIEHARNKFFDLNAVSPIEGRNFFRSVYGLIGAKKTAYQHYSDINNTNWDEHPYYNELLCNVKWVNGSTAVTIFKPDSKGASIIEKDYKETKVNALEFALDLCEEGAGEITEFPMIVEKTTGSERDSGEKTGAFVVLNLHELINEVLSQDSSCCSLEKRRDLITRLALQSEHLKGDDSTLSFLCKESNQIKNPDALISLSNVVLERKLQGNEEEILRNINLDTPANLKKFVQSYSKCKSLDEALYRNILNQAFYIGKADLTKASCRKEVENIKKAFLQYSSKKTLLQISFDNLNNIKKKLESMLLETLEAPKEVLSFEETLRRRVLGNARAKKNRNLTQQIETLEKLIRKVYMRLIAAATAGGGCDGEAAPVAAAAPASPVMEERGGAAAASPAAAMEAAASLVETSHAAEGGGASRRTGTPPLTDGEPTLEGAAQRVSRNRGLASRFFSFLGCTSSEPGADDLPVTPQ
jgi:hypothetical protein